MDLTESRLRECTGWNLNELNGSTILELGSGAGRFTEIFLKYGAYVVSVELSNAAEANYQNNKNRDRNLIPLNRPNKI